VEEVFDSDLAEFVRLQREVGLDYFSDGLLRWQDIFRPLVEASAELRPGALVRWFDNNAFFRSPEVRGALSPITAPPLAPDGSVPRPRVATLPSPYMFSRAAHTTLDRNRLMLDLARELLRPMASAQVAAGCEVVHLQEPWLAFFGIDPADWGPFGEALAVIHDGLPATLVLHVYFGDAAPFADRLRRLPMDAVGVDLMETDVDALGADWEIGLLAGCLDGRTSMVESVDSAADLVRRVAAAVRPPRLYLSSNCELEFLPRDVAVRKVRRLGEVAAAVRAGTPA
jgi:5-methyltetrahydropteroyltriglutamate--homocysteine methyltransferase